MQKRAFEENFEIVSDCFPIKDGGEISVDKSSMCLPREPISSLHYHNTIEIGICTSGAGLFYSYLNSRLETAG